MGNRANIDIIDGFNTITNSFMEMFNSLFKKGKYTKYCEQ